VGSKEYVAIVGVIHISDENKERLRDRDGGRGSNEILSAERRGSGLATSRF
jgi:hypothetical protein